MEQDENKSKENKGCAIFTGILIAISVIYFFMTTKADEIADYGVFFTTIIFLVAAYFGIKAFDKNSEDIPNKLVRIGIPVAIFLFLMLILGATIKDFNTMVIIGSVGFILFCVVVGVMIYNGNKD